MDNSTGVGNIPQQDPDENQDPNLPQTLALESIALGVGST